MKQGVEATRSRLYTVFMTSGMDVCEFITLSLLELAKLMIAEAQDIEEGLAHLKEHIAVLDGSKEQMRSALDIVTVH